MAVPSGAKLSDRCRGSGQGTPNVAGAVRSSKGSSVSGRARAMNVFHLELGIRGQGSGVRSQESGVRGQESGVRNQGAWVRGQGAEVGDEGCGVRSRGWGIRGEGSGVWRQTCVWWGLAPDPGPLTPAS